MDNMDNEAVNVEVHHQEQEALLSLLHYDSNLIKKDELSVQRRRDTDEKQNDNDGDSKDKDTTIRELQRRLEKRNILLDLVRKAYHRDVLVVKDIVLRQLEIPSDKKLVNCNDTDQTLNSVVNEITNEDTTLKSKHKNVTTRRTTTSSSLLPSNNGISLLSSIPSIDLRHKGLHLFSPQECEMRLKPCLECGGYLEVIHRESSKYKALLRHKDELLCKISQLEQELVDTKQVVCDKTEEFTQLQQTKKQIDEANNVRINQLEQYVAGYDELKSFSSSQKQMIDDLTMASEEKDLKLEELQVVKVEIANVTKQISTHQKSFHDLKQKHDEISIQLLQALVREQNKENKITELNRINEDLNTNILFLESELSRTKDEVNSNLIEISILKENMQQDKNEYNSIKDELKTCIDCKEKCVSKLKNENSIANENIMSLRKELKEEKAHFEEYMNAVKGEIHKNQIEEENRRIHEEAARMKLNERIDFFMTITSSYIQGLYEQCLVQEQLILVEDSSSRPMQSRHRLKGRNTEQINMLLEKLENKIESIHIDWRVLLQNDDDRRVIFGNLNNRSQMNLSYIDNLIKNTHAKYCSIISRIESDNNYNLNQLVLRHRNDQNQLQMQISSKHNNYNCLEKTFHDKSKKLSEALRDIDSLRELLHEREAHIIEKENQISDLQQHEVNLYDEISMIKKQLKENSELISLKDEEIKDQSDTLNHLEAILQKTMTRYAAIVDKDRWRLESNINFGAQVAPSVKEFSQQADFLYIDKASKQKKSESNTRQRVKTNLVEL